MNSVHFRITNPVAEHSWKAIRNRFVGEAWDSGYIIRRHTARGYNKGGTIFAIQYAVDLEIKKAGK